MSEARFDVWLHGMSDTPGEPAAEALRRVFQLSAEVADGLVASLPRVVKRDASTEQAARIVAALQALGGRASAVQRPLAPVPVLRVGEEAAHTETAEPSAPRSATAETVKLGTLDLPQLASWFPQSAPLPASTVQEALPPAQSVQHVAVALAEAAPTSGWQDPVSASTGVPVQGFAVTRFAITEEPSASFVRAPSVAPPVEMPHESMRPPALQAQIPMPASIPAPASAAPPAIVALSAAPPAIQSLSAAPIALVSLSSPAIESFEVTRNLIEWQAATPIQAPRHVPSELALDLDEPRPSRAAPPHANLGTSMALPLSNPPPSPIAGLRPPSQRTSGFDRPQRKASAQPASQGGWLDAAVAVFGGGQRSEESSMQALRKHPAIGFLTVLLGTTCVFLLIFAVL